MTIDPNAATARYIDSLGPAALQKAHDYTVGKEWMLLWALLVTALVTWAIVRWGILDRLAARASGSDVKTSARSSSASLFLSSRRCCLCPGPSTTSGGAKALRQDQPADRGLARPSSARRRH